MRRLNLLIATRGLRALLYRLTRTAYLYNGCLALYNVVLTSSVNTVKRQQSHLRSRAINVLNHCMS